MHTFNFKSSVLGVSSTIFCPDEQCGVRLRREGPRYLSFSGGWLLPAAIGSCVASPKRVVKEAERRGE